MTSKLPFFFFFRFQMFFLIPAPKISNRQGERAVPPSQSTSSGLRWQSCLHKYPRPSGPTTFVTVWLETSTCILRVREAFNAFHLQSISYSFQLWLQVLNPCFGDGNVTLPRTIKKYSSPRADLEV